MSDPEIGGNESTLPRWARTLTSTFAALFTFLCVAWSIDIPTMIGWLLYTEQLITLVLALAFVIAFLRITPSRKERKGPVPWYDIGAAFAGFVAAGYVAVRFPVLTDQFYYRPVEILVLSSLLVGLVVEMLRRAAGWSFVIVFATFVAYALFANRFSGALLGQPTEPKMLISILGLGSGAMLGRPLAIVTTIIVAFVFMGQLLFKSGGSNFFTDFSSALMGRSRGGAAKIAVCASSLFGSISGSAVSNVVSTGVVTIPMMQRSGYRPHVAAAIEAVASTGGQIMPPIMGAVAFLMAEFIQVPYTEVVIAAIVPAILYYVAIFIMADLEAARTGIAALPDSALPRFSAVMREGWYFPLPFVLLVVAMFSWNYTPEAAAIYASILIILLGSLFRYKGERLNLRSIWDAAVQTGYAMADILAICATAGMIIGILNLSGLGFSLTVFLVDASGGTLFPTLVLTGVVCIVLGMSMPTISMYVLLAVLAAPALVELGVRPMAAHLFVVYFGLMSMITPPVALCAFTAAKLANCDPMRTAFAATAIGWPAYIVPFLFVYSPSLMLEGPLVTVAFAVITAIAGVWLTTVGFMGFLFRKLGIPARIAFSISGLALLIPSEVFEAALWLNLAGIAVGAVLVLTEYRGRIVVADTEGY